MMLSGIFDDALDLRGILAIISNVFLAEAVWESLGSS